MKTKLHAHAKRNQLFYTISAIILVLVSCALLLNYRSIYRSQNTFYTSTLEHQSLASLDLYHEGSSQLVTQYFTLALATINTLATDPTVQQQVASHQSAILTNTLEQELGSTPQFSSMTLMDGKGSLVAFKDQGGKQIAPGTDLTKSPAYEVAKDAQSVKLIDLHHSSLGRNVFSITAPIRNKQGSLTGVVSCAMTLPNLADKMKLSSAYDTNFDALLTDSAGNALIWDNQAMSTGPLLNLKAKEPLLGRLSMQAEIPAVQEYNFKQQDSFARASTIDFKDTGKLYLVSYYNMQGYKQQVEAGRESVRKTMSGFFIRDTIFTIIALALIAWVVRYHEQHC